ncbi:MAG TPA: SH3 domain-containing protein [Sphingobium sp.]
MTVRREVMAVCALAALALAGGADAQSLKKPPYWASIAKNAAVLRIGPGKRFPGNWVYLRRDLPVRVIETYPDWRKVQDPDGTTGWFHVRLLKDDPTAIVKGRPAEMHDKPTASSRLLYRLAPGVVGKLTGCASGWCAFDTNGKAGYVLASSLWGAVD